MVTFCVREVRRAIRKFMEEAEYARTALTPQDLEELVMGPESPDISSQRQPWTCPELEEQEEGVDAEEEGIDNNGNMMFSSLIKIIVCTMITLGFWKHVTSSIMAALCCNTQGNRVPKRIDQSLGHVSNPRKLLVVTLYFCNNNGNPMQYP
jgi:hypothetical protein